MTAIDVLIRFGRLASESGEGHEILPLLAEAAVEHVGADAAAVIEIVPGGRAKIVAVSNMPVRDGWSADAETIGEELGALLLKQSEGRFEQARTLLLASSGGLFGALVLLFVHRQPIDPTRLDLARGLADLAAISLDRVTQLARVARANAELRMSRDVLARTEKLRALGQMAAGVSHDLKNLCNPLSLHLQIAERAIARGAIEQATSSLDEMKIALRRALETLDRLREFSRQTPESKTQTVHLNTLVHEAVEIAKPRMSSRNGALCKIVEDLGVPPPVVARAGEVVSAIVNLVVNAIDASQSGGTITLSTGEAGGGGWIRVTDTGPGMPPEVQERVFEPFFTTKGTEGTGLGLAMVYATMQRHGGTTTLETAPGAGAAFTLWFPGGAKSDM
jgi:signal transduction histidine kinase